MERLIQPLFLFELIDHNKKLPPVGQPERSSLNLYKIMNSSLWCKAALSQ